MRLNDQQIKVNAILQPDHTFLKAMAGGTIAAVQTKQCDLRHLVQKSVVTIHGRDVPLQKLPEAEKFLARIYIPAKHKDEFRRVLSLYGISQSLLFPDLENLSKELGSMKFSPTE